MELLNSMGEISFAEVKDLFSEFHDVLINATNVANDNSCVSVFYKETRANILVDITSMKNSELASVSQTAQKLDKLLQTMVLKFLRTPVEQCEFYLNDRTVPCNLWSEYFDSGFEVEVFFEDKDKVSLCRLKAPYQHVNSQE